MARAAIIKNAIAKTYHKSKHISQILTFQSKRVLRRVKRKRYIKKRDKTRNNIYGEQPNRVLIFNIFEANERIQAHKLIFLKKLREVVTDCYIIVNGTISEEDAKILKGLGNLTIRENKGYDVAAFRKGIQLIGREKLASFDQLLIVNDTNIGPFYPLEEMFNKMDSQHLDFWGISLGEQQEDFTKMNPLGYIPVHIQTFFLVVEKSLLNTDDFYDYWDNIGDTDSRDKAIGKHETYFTSYFYNLGYRFDTIVKDYSDSAVYIHPLRTLIEGSPIVKYTALGNYDNEQFIWQELERESEVPALVDYIREETDYPVEIIEQIIDDFKKKNLETYILIVDGVENVIPQCTRYRVENKAEQFKNHGIPVEVVGLSKLNLKKVQNASSIIFYRCADHEFLDHIIAIANRTNKKVYYDIDDLVFDTKYTDQLAYTQNLAEEDKVMYDRGVKDYNKLLMKCHAVITSTNQLAEELKHYKNEVYIMRNVLSEELVSISEKTPHQPSDDDKVKVGYFSGSITHNENFELIKSAIIQMLEKYPKLELHLVGHLDIPEEFKKFESQLVTHPYMEWTELPKLISKMDVNLAPLVTSIFNEAKSEIKWLEAAMVKVVTLASDLGAFTDMVENGKTGVLAKDDEWAEALEKLITQPSWREELANKAYEEVKMNHTTKSNIELFLEK